MLRSATFSDAPVIAQIYNHYIANTVITFEEELVSADEMTQRIAEISSAGMPWLVCQENERVIGFAYASKWKSRCAYRHSVETSIYLRNDATGRGLGHTLYKGLITDLKKQGYHSIIGGAALPNPASIALHEKLGFVKVAHFKEVGRKFDQWIDVGYWELIL